QPAVAVADAPGSALHDRGGFALLWRGDLFLQAGREGLAVRLYRTGTTLRAPRRADGRAQLHQRGIEVADAFAGQNLLRAKPEIFLRLTIARVILHSVDPAENALNISIQNR